MSENLHQLSPEDQRVFDALLEAGFDVAAVPAVDRPRAEKLVALMGLLDHLPAPSPGDLLAERTIAAVSQTRKKEKATGTFGSAGGWGPPVRLSDIAAVAAILIVAVALTLPSMNHSREQSRQLASQANLGGAFQALTSYAGDHRDRLPQTQFRAGDPWLHTNTFDADGNAQSNSAHAFVLIRTGHADPKTLISPTNIHAPQTVTLTMRDWENDRQISYSFRNVHLEALPTISGPTVTAVMADKNPLIYGGKFRDDLAIDSNSANHQRLGGQNVLLSDGRVVWVDTPIINGDNIWTPGDAETLDGTEVPVNEHDSFLVQ